MHNNSYQELTDETLFSDQWMNALTRKTPVMLSLWTEATDLNHSATEALIFFFIQLLDLHLLIQSVHITSNVVSSNPAQARCTRYTIM
jgi:hypothetical protein